MRRVDRLWIQAIQEGHDMKLMRLLRKLKAISSVALADFATSAEHTVWKYQDEQYRKRSKQTNREKTTYGRPPMSIKPNKARNR